MRWLAGGRIEYSSQVQPMLLTPAHGSLPSGHGTESFAAAATLLAVLRASGVASYADEIYATQLLRLASRITINRTVAGLHFPIDNVAGALLGLTLGDYFVARARPADPQNPAAKEYEAAHFDATRLMDAGGPNAHARRDFEWKKIYDGAAGLVRFPARTPDPADGHAAVQPFDRLGGDNVVGLGADTPSAVLAVALEGAVAEWR